MVLAFKPLQDATLYEAYPYKNTGLDEILEIQKTISDSTFTESRPILLFDTNAIATALTNFNVSGSNAYASLVMNTVQYSEVPLNYIIEVDAVSGSWTNGTGKYADISLSGGVTWVYTQGESNQFWLTSSYAAGSTGNYNVLPGGGTWYTSSIATQSFSFKQDNDLNVDVTDMVRSWLTGSFDNNGMLVRLRNISSADYLLPTNIQFYSSETHTVYSPTLRIQWDSSTTYTTGSLVTASLSDNPIVYLYGFKGEYKPDVSVRVFVRSRPMYPKKTFSQNPDYGTVLALPADTYYRILDAHTNEIIVDYSNYTKVDCDSNGNYFDFSTTSLYPERFYKFEFKSTISNKVEYFTDEYLFKIVNY